MTKQAQRDQQAARAYRGRDQYDYWRPLEPVTEKLIDELAAKGWDAQQVRILGEVGWKYDRRRDVLVQPAE